MWGKEQIEWQDRSWRLLEMPGQVKIDDWTVAGMVVAPVVWAGAGMGTGLTGKRWMLGLTGAGAVGSVAGTIGYMVWRFGMNGGKFPIKKEIAI